MELVILAGLAGLGYKASQAKKFVQPPSLVDRNLKNDGPICALYERQYKDMLNPIDTGIVPPNMPSSMSTGCIGLPHLTSARTMSTNTAWKQGRMEMFTGNLDRCKSQTGTYVPKKEVPSLFSPVASAQPLTSLGTAGNTNMVPNVDRYFVSGKQSGVGPTDRIQVGPGLGLGPDQQSGGSFHPYFRLLPKNINEHKLNRSNLLPTRTGGSDGTRLEAPALFPNTSANRQSQRHDLHTPRSLLPTSGGNLQGPVQRPQHNVIGGVNNLPEAHFGAASGGQHGSGLGMLRGAAEPQFNQRQGNVDQQMEPQILNVRGVAGGFYANPENRLSARPHAQQLPITNLSGGQNNNNTGLGVGHHQESYKNTLRPTDRNGIALPVAMPSHQSSISVRQDGLFSQAATPVPDRSGNFGSLQRSVGNPSLSYGGAATPQHMTMKEARPIVGYTPGAQNNVGNPTPGVHQLGSSVRNKIGGREANLMAVNQGAVSGGVHPSNQAMWLMQPTTCVRDREAWQRPVAPGGGLLAA